RRRKSAALLVLLTLAAAGAAHAVPYERPARKMLFAFKIDRYDPKIDSEKGLNGATPYHNTFGPRAPLRYQLEADWEIARPFGTFLAGVTAGYWQNFGKGLFTGCSDP